VQELGRMAGIQVVPQAVECDVVAAEQGRGLRRVRGAAKRPQERHVVDRRQFLVAQPGRRAQPRRDHGGAQRLLQRRALARVGGERHGRQRIGQPNTHANVHDV
jgi:hypothetical protein